MKRFKSPKDLPDRIRVGPYDWKLEQWDVRESYSEKNYGDCNTVDMVVRVCTDHRWIKVVDTLLHELSHAIYHAYSIASSDDEERTVALMSTAWVQIFRDNPWLHDYIRSGVAAK
jgi:hypothetical protein